MKNKLRLLIMIIFLIPQTVLAKNNIVLENFWVVNAPSAARYTAAYGIIKNTGTQDDILLSVSNENGTVMMHNSLIQNGKATMKHVKHITIKAQQQFVFKPMSYHLMFSNPNKNTTTHKKNIAFIFHFKKAGNIPILLPIKNPW